MPTWNDLTRNNPSHSENYAARWKRFVAEGKDIDGEARFVDALSPRGAKILDAGCGTGRAGGPLIARGHTVAGIDLDPVLIEHAKHDFPDAEWHVGDLGSATLYEQPELGHMRGSFDVVLASVTYSASLTQRIGKTPSKISMRRCARAAAQY